MENEKKYCMCCAESKSYYEFYLTKNAPSIYCKLCYQNYTTKERKVMEYRNVFKIIKNIKADL